MFREAYIAAPPTVVDEAVAFTLPSLIVVQAESGTKLSANAAAVVNLIMAILYWL